MDNNKIFVQQFDEHIKLFLLKNKFNLIKTPSGHKGICQDHLGQTWEIIEISIFPTKARRANKMLIDTRIDDLIIKTILYPMLLPDGEVKFI